jgi:hypothetical protein
MPNSIWEIVAVVVANEERSVLRDRNNAEGPNEHLQSIVSYHEYPLQVANPTRFELTASFRLKI